MSEEQKSLGEVAYTALRHHTDYQHWASWEATVPHQRQLYEAMAHAVKEAVLADDAVLRMRPPSHTHTMVGRGIRECREAMAALQRVVVYLEEAETHMARGHEGAPSKVQESGKRETHG